MGHLECLLRSLLILLIKSLRNVLVRQEHLGLIYHYQIRVVALRIMAFFKAPKLAEIVLLDLNMLLH